MFPFVLLLMLSAGPSGPVPVQDNFDRVTVNHYYDTQGRHVLSQLIFEDFSYVTQRHEVVAYKVLHNRHQLPRKQWGDERYRMRFFDGKMLRLIWCEDVIENWTMYDPELRERDILPIEFRSGLATPHQPIRQATPTINRFGNPE